MFILLFGYSNTCDMSVSGHTVLTNNARTVQHVNSWEKNEMPLPIKRFQQGMRKDARAEHRR
jgi:ribosomal protein S6